VDGVRRKEAAFVGTNPLSGARLAWI